MHENEITSKIIDICCKIHKQLGPGLLESVYEEILLYELRKIGLNADRQVPIPVEWDGQIMEIGFRADLVVENKVIVDLKSVEQMKPVYFKTLLTYLRQSKLRLGLLINFGEHLRRCVKIKCSSQS